MFGGDLLGGGGGLQEKDTTLRTAVIVLRAMYTTIGININNPLPRTKS